MHLRSSSMFVLLAIRKIIFTLSKLVKNKNIHNKLRNLMLLTRRTVQTVFAQLTAQNRISFARGHVIREGSVAVS